jgi:hypothetical protein
MLKEEMAWSQVVAKGTEVNYRNLKILGVPVEIRTGYLPDRRSKHYRWNTVDSGYCRFEVWSLLCSNCEGCGLWSCVLWREMEKAWFSEISMNFYQTTRRHIVMYLCVSYDFRSNQRLGPISLTGLCNGDKACSLRGVNLIFRSLSLFLKKDNMLMGSPCCLCLWNPQPTF